MPLRPARVGRVGVIGAPVAKTAVVAAAVTPGPSPVAKTAVVAAAVTPGRVGRRRNIARARSLESAVPHFSRSRLKGLVISRGMAIHEHGQSSRGVPTPPPRGHPGSTVGSRRSEVDRARSGPAPPSGRHRRSVTPSCGFCGSERVYPLPPRTALDRSWQA